MKKEYIAYFIITIICSAALILMVLYLQQEVKQRNQVNTSDSMNTDNVNKDFTNVDYKKEEKTVENINQKLPEAIKKETLHKNNLPLTVGEFLTDLRDVLLRYDITISLEQMEKGSKKSIKEVYPNLKGSEYYYILNDLYFLNTLINPDKDIRHVLGDKFNASNEIEIVKAQQIFDIYCNSANKYEDKSYEVLQNNFVNCLRQKYNGN